MYEKVYFYGWKAEGRRRQFGFAPEGETRTGRSWDTPEYLRCKAMEWQDAEFFKLHAEELNREAEDVLKYQCDIFDLIPPYET